MKIICVGRNYVSHIKELNNQTPEEPVLFMKPMSALYDGVHPLALPSFSKEVHHEIEIVLRVKKEALHIVEKDSWSIISDITVGIDFTARDIQSALKSKGLPWEKAKAYYHSAVIGSWSPLLNNDFSKSICFHLLRNGVKVQNGDSSLMIYSFSYLIAYISSFFLLEEGDLIFTGTPAGVGPCYSKDILEGYLENEMKFSIAIA